jgi:hypothetical protein
LTGGIRDWVQKMLASISYPLKIAMDEKWKTEDCRSEYFVLPTPLVVLLLSHLCLCFCMCFSLFLAVEIVADLAVSLMLF